MTTRPDVAAARPPDLVGRDFTATAPNRLWLVDFTYVPTWSGTAFTAFVADAYSRRIVGWRTAASMPTSLPLDALEMSLWTRARAGHTIGGRPAVVFEDVRIDHVLRIRVDAEELDPGRLANRDGR